MRNLTHSRCSPVSELRILPQALPSPYAEVSLRISREDVRRMDYHLNECPMANPFSNNAVVFALRRLLRDDVDIKVSVRGGEASARLDGNCHPLGEAVSDWLRGAFMGCPVAPVSFRVRLPVEYLRPGIADGPREEIAGSFSGVERRIRAVV